MKTKTNNMKRFTQWFIAFSAIAIVSLCSGEVSDITGWDYNNRGMRGIGKFPYADEDRSVTFLVLACRMFRLASAEDALMYDWNYGPRSLTVSSFYTGRTEGTHFHLLEYLDWISSTYPSYPMLY